MTSILLPATECPTNLSEDQTGTEIAIPAQPRLTGEMSMGSVHIYCSTILQGGHSPGSGIHVATDPSEGQIPMLHNPLLVEDEKHNDTQYCGAQRIYCQGNWRESNL